jgi:hypothetical protein
MSLLTIDAHHWMRRLRFEHWRVPKLRSLRVGERLFLGMFEGPGITPEMPGICEVYFERRRGGLYSFHATWTITWLNKIRPHIFAVGDFRLQPFNTIEFLAQSDWEGERHFRLAAGYCAFFHRHARTLGLSLRPKHETGHFPLFRGEVVDKYGYTTGRTICRAPIPKGLAALAEVAMAVHAVPAQREENQHAHRTTEPPNNSAH